MCRSWQRVLSFSISISRSEVVNLESVEKSLIYEKSDPFNDGAPDKSTPSGNIKLEVYIWDIE